MAPRTPRKHGKEAMGTVDAVEGTHACHASARLCITITRGTAVPFEQHGTARVHHLMHLSTSVPHRSDHLVHAVWGRSIRIPGTPLYRHTLWHAWLPSTLYRYPLGFESSFHSMLRTSHALKVCHPAVKRPSCQLPGIMGLMLRHRCDVLCQLDAIPVHPETVAFDVNGL